jgi:hypothetical protein
MSSLSPKSLPKWMPAGLGAEPKKVAILAVLLVVAGIAYFMNSGPNVPAGVTTTPVAPRDPEALKNLPPRPAAGSRNSTVASLTPMPAARAANRRGDASFQDFKPSLKLPDGVDVASINPTLKLELLAKLQELPMQGGERSLFDFGAAPKPKVIAAAPAKPKPVVTEAPPAPVAAPAPPVAAVKPPPPPIPLKFYGYVGGNSRQAFFLEGEDIFVAGPNELIRNRYKVMQINVRSAVVEDTTTKSQQTLPLVDEL